MIGEKAQKVLDYMRLHGSITTEEARKDLGITNLSRVVIPCLKRHINIRSEWVDGKKPNGTPTKMCRYYVDDFLWFDDDKKAQEASETAVKRDYVTLKKAEAWDKLKKLLQDNKNLAWMLISGSDVNRTLYTVYKWILAIMRQYERERGENDEVNEEK